MQSIVLDTILPIIRKHYMSKFYKYIITAYEDYTYIYSSTFLIRLPFVKFEEASVYYNNEGHIKNFIQLLNEVKDNIDVTKINSFPELKPSICSNCDGKGYVYHECSCCDGDGTLDVNCPCCNERLDVTCHKCEGEGQVEILCHAKNCSGGLIFSPHEDTRLISIEQGKYSARDIYFLSLLNAELRISQNKYNYFTFQKGDGIILNLS